MTSEQRGQLRIFKTFSDLGHRRQSQLFQTRHAKVRLGSGYGTASTLQVSKHPIEPLNVFLVGCQARLFIVIVVFGPFHNNVVNKRPCSFRDMKLKDLGDKAYKSCDRVSGPLSKGNHAHEAKKGHNCRKVSTLWIQLNLIILRTLIDE